MPAASIHLLYEWQLHLPLLRGPAEAVAADHNSHRREPHLLLPSVPTSAPSPQTSPITPTPSATPWERLDTSNTSSLSLAK